VTLRIVGTATPTGTDDARARQRLREIFTSFRRWEASRATREAMAVLARSHVSTPCRRDPGGWERVRDISASDGDPNSEAQLTENASAAYPRISAAIRACQDCPLLTECQHLRDTLNPDDPELVGVLAGELIQHGKAAIRVRQMGERRQWR